MSSSSRSIAAARARRAGEQAPPMSGTRPGTSIGSHAAFAPQMQQQQYQQQPPPNVRVSRGQPPMPPQMQQQMQQQMSSQMQQPTANGLPFSKLSISDAIGLITLRLGRVEQFIIDVENGESNLNVSHHELSSSSIPENSKVIDTSVLTNIVTRLDSLEKRESTPINSELVTKINEEIASISLQVKKLNEDIVKSNTLASQNNEKIFKFDRDLIETKDLLRSLVMKMDLHIQETNEKFGDYEYAIAEIEKNFQIPLNEPVLNTENMGFSIEEQPEQELDNSAILSVDLKNIIKQELANV
jgi:hypothetical protein